MLARYFIRRDESLTSFVFHSIFNFNLKRKVRTAAGL